MGRYAQHPDKPIANGYCIGIMDFPWHVPFIPGDVTNASSYDFPVLIKTYKGVDLTRCATGDPNQKEKVVGAALDMARQGVKGISADCGFLLNYLPDVTRAVGGLPVFLSSLQLLPLAASFISLSKSISIFTPFPDAMTPDFLAKAGFKGERRIVPTGLMDCPEFSSKLLQESNEVDSDRVEKEIVELALDVKYEHPELGAFLFECSMLPPYSHAVQAATGLPVFDYITLIKLLFRATHQQHYVGFY